LGTAVEHYLGLSLAKEHSAVDWSRRPLPEPWLRYAALDVEVLVQLRDAVEADLRDQDKLDWALEEFDALLHFSGPSPRVDPWRRTSGMHRIRRRRGIAVLRELWYVRDRVAQRRDVSPGRVLSDAALVGLAVDPPKDSAALAIRRELRGISRGPRVWTPPEDLQASGFAAALRAGGAREWQVEVVAPILAAAAAAHP
jgi:ribonuclease D